MTVLCPTDGSLPEQHFAVLFEGAWLFTQDPTSEEARILASSPLTDNHECTFGLWSPYQLGIPGVKTNKMPPDRLWYVNVLDVISPKKDFSCLFDEAAHNYPFPYVPNHGIRSPQAFGMHAVADQPLRQVSISMPTSVRAAGAMLSAEIDGRGAASLCSSSGRGVRPHVTFIFIYEYSDCTTAELEYTLDAGEETVALEVQTDPPSHLVFNIHPTEEMRMSGRSMAAADMDEAAQKTHVMMTFDALRRLASSKSTCGTGASEGSICDIAIYHGRTDIVLYCGDSGLTQYELGLAPYPKIGPFARKVASCAGGGMVVGPPKAMVK